MPRWCDTVQHTLARAHHRARQRVTMRSHDGTVLSRAMLSRDDASRAAPSRISLSSPRAPSTRSQNSKNSSCGSSGHARTRARAATSAYGSGRRRGARARARARRGQPADSGFTGHYMWPLPDTKGSTTARRGARARPRTLGRRQNRSAMTWACGGRVSISAASRHSASSASSRSLGLSRAYL